MTPPRSEHLPDTQDALPPVERARPLSEPHLARPESEGTREVKAALKILAGAARTIVGIGAVAGAGATGGITAHRLSEYRLAQVEARVQEQAKTYEVDKAAHQATHAELERDLQAVRLDSTQKLGEVNAHMAEVKTSVDDMREMLQRVLKEREEQPRRAPYRIELERNRHP